MILTGRSRKIKSSSSSSSLHDDLDDLGVVSAYASDADKSDIVDVSGGHGDPLADSDADDLLVAKSDAEKSKDQDSLRRRHPKKKTTADH